MDMMRIGIDIGALFLKIVCNNGKERPEFALYTPHLGDPVKALSRQIDKLPGGEHLIGVTGSGSSLVTKTAGLRNIHDIEAQVAAAKLFFPYARNILDIGGGSCTIINLDESGNFLNYTTNSLCAAGTGSFLDEQARRLEIAYEDMPGYDYTGTPPNIASRCAVFAKSDLIHRQQEGYSRKEMWGGLCKGCVDTLLQTLLKGKPLSGQTVITGGVVQNPSIMRWLKTYYGDMIVTFDNAHLSGAIGSALLADGKPIAISSLLGTTSGKAAKEKIIKRGVPLLLKLSNYPSFKVETEWKDDLGNEVRLWATPDNEHAQVYMGIDIGSTSTKLVLLDSDDEVLVDIYRKTLGDPIGAVQKLFTAIEEIQMRYGITYEVIGCGTTGSGRKFIGKIIGADQVINEISAHVAGAMKTDPTIDTIFEIGGQDSKYMRTVNGHIRDANMNFICAAGTGSFVEEQANKLDFNVAKIGEQVMGIAPPETSDRCTVFMEEDTRMLLRQGYTREEAIAAVMNSVVKNYLNKVVGNRHVSKHKIFFQGATARNKGLVAAFENQLGVEIVVSPLCHQMGSYGLALLTSKHMRDAGETSSFIGFDFAHKQINVVKETCEACTNMCEISFAEIEGMERRPSWGYMCGREPDEEKRKVNRHFSLFRKRNRMLYKEYKKQSVKDDAPIVAIPNSLTAHSLLPFWTALLNGLGYRLELTGKTTDDIRKRGARNASGDFCFPVKVAIGHALALPEMRQADFMMIPQMISAEPNSFSTNRFYCPYVQSYAGVVRSMFKVNGIDDAKLLAPMIDLRCQEKLMVKELEESLGKPLGKNRKAVKLALGKALAAQKEFDMGCKAEGEKALAALEKSGEKGIVIVGRPYNCFDEGSNLGLPEKISEYGYHVIPVDFLPFDRDTLGDEYANIYWNYGQRIISSLKTAAASKNLFPVYLSNFNCGPDSFLLTYAEQVMGEKPLLILELDEHGADAGYLTRVEAFLDVVAQQHPARPARPVKEFFFTNEDYKRRTLWIPPMHPHASELASAIFERFGYKARALPPEDRQAYEIGRAQVRGSECLPTSVTIGGLLKTLREENADPKEHAFFMATATGPCRFGQYALLHRMILDKNGYADMPILSPSSINSYQGLDEKLRRELWWAFLVADVLFKMECRVRPYENRTGQTNEVVAQQKEFLCRTLAKSGNLEQAIRKTAAAFDAIPRTNEQKPLVGIVGEIYVRCNPFSNGYVVDHIEKYGGEAWLAPLAEWFLYTAHIQKWSASQNLLNFSAKGRSLLKNKFLGSSEHKIYQWTSKILADRHEPPVEQVVDEGRKYLPINFEGEAIITIGRAIKFADQGACLVVNCAPFGCMPGTLTSSIFQEIEAERSVPMVSMYYDGEGEINKGIEIYIHEAQNATCSGKADIKVESRAEA